MLRATALAAGLLWAAAGAAAPAGPGTLRLDLVHTGGPGVEVFAVDRVTVEPLPWPGHPERTGDDGTTGAYRFEVRDPDSGRVLFARGYSSIYGEWATTAEASQAHRSFHESLRFPLPERTVDVVVERRGPDQRFAPLWRTRVDPAAPTVDRSQPLRQALIEVERHGAPPDKVDLLLIGDGYTAEGCARAFPAEARRLSDALFGHEPFASRRTDFNVWGLCPPAQEAGVSRPSAGVHRRSPVGATYDALGAERYVLTFDNRALRDVAAWAPYEFVVILVNSATYGGGGIYGAFATVAAGSAWSEYLFVHEFGHHFAALADEYYTSPAVYEPAAQVVEPWEANVTALLDGEPLKWRTTVRAGTPIPTPWPKDAFETAQRDFQARRKAIRAANRPEPEMDALFREERAWTTALLREAAHAGEVGAFRGANYDAEAYYRSEIDCKMFTRNDVPFCGVCRQALERVIDQYAGPRRAP
jgi:hypothetical protein